MKVEVAVVGSQPSLIVRTISVGVINTEPELAQWTVVSDFTQKRVASLTNLISMCAAFMGHSTSFWSRTRMRKHAGRH